MPRDLQSLKEDSQPGGSVTNEQTTSPSPMSQEDENSMVKKISETHGKSKRDELHPYTQSLTINDIESCTKLEEVTFPPEERCTKEKFHYRLSHCSELSLGIFTSSEDESITTHATSGPVYSGHPERKVVLLGHIVATKTTNPVVTDDDMHIPTHTDPPTPHYGHKEEGRTVCIHSLAVLPKYQKMGLGSTLMKAYLDRLKHQDVADRAALLAHGPLIGYYERFGFVRKGESQAQFGGGGWFDMVIDLKAPSAGGGMAVGENDPED